TDHSARRGDDLFAVEEQIEPALEHVDELVLGGMDVGRHEGARREGRVPGERGFAYLLRHVSLAEDVPDDPVDAGAGLGDARGHSLHETRPPCSSPYSTMKPGPPETGPGRDLPLA